MASGAGYTPELFSESGVGVVVLVLWIVSSIQVIQPLQSGVDCVAELVVFVNEHSFPIFTHLIRKVGTLKNRYPHPVKNEVGV